MKADFCRTRSFPLRAKSGEQSGGRISLHVDHAVIFFLPDGHQHFKQVAELLIFFVPHQQMPDEGMLDKQAFIPFSHQEINGRIRNGGVNIFNESSREHHVTDECCLNDQDFLRHEG